MLKHEDLAQFTGTAPYYRIGPLVPHVLLLAERIVEMAVVESPRMRRCGRHSKNPAAGGIDPLERAGTMPEPKGLSGPVGSARRFPVTSPASRRGARPGAVTGAGAGCG
jgi:hypothetical protein